MLMTGLVLPQVGATFRAVAETIVPETRSLSAGGWASLESTVEHALSMRPETVRKQLVLFLRAIELLPVFRHRRRFRHLDAASRASVLTSLESSKLLVLRRGFWGLRTLVMMGYYTQPSIQAALGYRANAEGWQLLRRSGEQAAIGESVA
jgi:hypothetical protein